MPARMKKISFLLALFPAISCTAGEVEQELLRCSALGDPIARLGCFDALAKSSAPVDVNAQPKSDKPPSAFTPPIQVQVAKAVEPPVELSRMTEQWELDDAARRGPFVLRQHRDNYLLLANLSNASNDEPFKAFTPSGVKAEHVEITYQLSLKMKVWEKPAALPVDVWVAYTQQSFWQAYNRSASSPFRETNYQPEVMAVVPLKTNFAGVNLRYFNFGAVHQSNGQTSTLSRSWNRLYVDLGLEYGKFTLNTRIWSRLDNAKSDNDNIDITDYMGHGDIRATYREKNGQEVSLMLRRNFTTGRGALQAGWSVPITANLKGYVQVFSGYGQSLIDYNYSQKSLGAGFMIDF